MSDTLSEAAGRSSPPRLCEFAVETTGQRLDTMLSFIDGVRQGEETEPVHQMRVWSRRTRAALEIFHVCFKDKAFQKLERDIKKAADAVGAARDLDVMIDNMKKRLETLPEQQRPGLEDFLSHLKHQRNALQKDVVDAVTRLEQLDLAPHFRELAARPDPECKPGKRRTKSAGKRDSHG
jgi:CHAD domain-containing protein